MSDIDEALNKAQSTFQCEVVHLQDKIKRVTQQRNRLIQLLSEVEDSPQLLDWWNSRAKILHEIRLENGGVE